MFFFSTLFAVASAVIILDGKEYRSWAVNHTLKAKNAASADFSKLDGEDVKYIPPCFMAKATPSQLDKMKTLAAYLPPDAKKEFILAVRQVAAKTAPAPVEPKASGSVKSKTSARAKIAVEVKAKAAAPPVSVRNKPKTVKTTGGAVNIADEPWAKASIVVKAKAAAPPAKVAHESSAPKATPPKNSAAPKAVIPKTPATPKAAPLLSSAAPMSLSHKSPVAPKAVPSKNPGAPKIVPPKGLDAPKVASNKAAASKNPAAAPKSVPFKDLTAPKTAPPLNPDSTEEVVAAPRPFRPSTVEFLKIKEQALNSAASPKEITQAFDQHPYVEVPLPPGPKKELPFKRDQINLMTDREIAIDSLFKFDLTNFGFRLNYRQAINHPRTSGWGYLKGKHPIVGICPRDHTLLVDWALMGVVLSVGLRLNTPSIKLGTWIKRLDIRLSGEKRSKLPTLIKYLRACKKANSSLWKSMVDYSLERVRISPGMANFDPYSNLPSWVTGVDPANEADDDIPQEEPAVVDDATRKKTRRELETSRQKKGFAPSLEKRIKQLLLIKPNMKHLPKGHISKSKVFNFLLQDPPQIFSQFEKDKDGLWKGKERLDWIAERAFNWLYGVNRLPHLSAEQRNLITEWAMISLIFDNNVPYPLNRFASWITRIPVDFLGSKRKISLHNFTSKHTLTLIELAKKPNQRLWAGLLEFAESHIRADPNYVPLPLMEAWSKSKQEKPSVAQNAEELEVGAVDEGFQNDENEGLDEDEYEDENGFNDEDSETEWESDETTAYFSTSTTTTTVTTTTPTPMTTQLHQAAQNNVEQHKFRPRRRRFIEDEDDDEEEAQKISKTISNSSNLRGAFIDAEDEDEAEPIHAIILG